MDSAYDRGLVEVGPGGIFQKKFDFIFNVVFSAIWSIIYIQMFLALTVVPHTCKLPEKTENVTADAWKLRYIPHETLYGKIKFDGCHMYSNPGENNLTNTCQEYEYDKTWYDSTVSSEKNWVCDKEIYIPNILAYSKVMELIGSMFFGWTGDAYGRRPTYIITLALTLIGRIISLMSGSSYIVFLCGCLMTSFGIWSVMQCATVISVEITSSKRRSLITSLRFGSGSLGISLMALAFWWLKDWKTFVIVTTSPLVLFLLFSWNIIESPRWQYSNGNTKECVNQLKTIAKKNHRNLQSKTEEEILSYVPQSSIKSLGPLAFFSGRTLAINTVLQLCLWTVGTICFSLQVLTISQNSDGNPFLELCCQTLSEIPANFVSAWLADNLGRRYSGALSFVFMSVAWLLLALRETSSYSWTRDGWIGTALNIVIRFVNAIAYYVCNLFAMELYPTFMRQTALSLGNVCASFGAVIAPYILFLGRPIDERLPGLIMATLALCAMCSCLLLPETLNKKLPETIEEAQSFGRRKQKYSSVPLTSNEKMEDKNPDEFAESHGGV